MDACNRTIVLALGPRGRRSSPATVARRSRTPSSSSAARPTPSGSGATSGTDGALYNFTRVPGEGYGDNGQGSEIELLLNGQALQAGRGEGPHPQPVQPEPVDELRRLRRQSNGDDCPAVHRRRLRRVRPALEPVRQAARRRRSRSPRATAGSTRPRSAPATGACSTRTSSASIRYIDRDNVAGPALPGLGRRASRSRGTSPGSRCPASGPGPNCNTGNYHAADAAYGVPDQVHRRLDARTSAASSSTSTTSRSTRRTATRTTGSDVRTRFRNTVVGAKVGDPPERARSTSRRRWYYSISRVDLDATCDAPRTLRPQRLLAGPGGQARRLEPGSSTSTSTTRSASASRSTSRPSTSAPSTSR